MSLMALDDDDDDEEIMGDSVCSTLSGCSLLECDNGGGYLSQRGQLDHQPAPVDGDYSVGAEIKSGTHADYSREGAAETDNRLFEHLADTGGKREHEEDRGTYRSSVMRQFKDDIDRLVQTVTQKIESSRNAVSGSSQMAAAISPSSMYSAVKSSCLSLLLSRVLPPLLERFEQRLMGNLLNSGLLPPPPPVCNRQDSVADTTVNESIASRSYQAPPLRPRPPPRPAPRLRTSAAEPAPTAAPPLPLSPLTPQPPPSAAVRRLRQTQCQQYRVSSSINANQQQQQHLVLVKGASSSANTSVIAPPAVRNNSSVKPPSPTAPSKDATLQSQRQRPRQLTMHSTSISCNELVHTFLVRDSPSLREILFDPEDRKMKSVSQRYGCYISVFEKTRRAGHLLHKVVVKAPSEKAFRMCINALDNGLSWDLASQLNRATKKSGSCVSAMTK